MSREKIIFVGILLLTFFAYSNTFYGEFQFDDDVAILFKEQIRNPSKFFQINPFHSLTHGGRPVTDFTFALNYYFGGVNVLGYHIFNFIIHILNGVLVYYFVLLTMQSSRLSISYHGRAQFIALLTSGIFLLHPIQTEAISYISQRYESLASLFYLLSLVAYIKARLMQQSAISYQQSAPHPSLPLEGGITNSELETPNSKLHATRYTLPATRYTLPAKRYTLYALSVVSGILALGSKEIAITLPVVILVYDFYFLPDRPFLKRISGIGIFILLSVIAGIFILIGFSGGIDAGFSVKAFTPWEYLMTQFRVITKYIGLLFLPINQNLDYDFRVSRSLFEADTFLSLIFLLALIITAILLFKKWGFGSFFILWFFIILSPTSSFIPIIDLIFEHRVYLASTGIFVIVSDVLSRLLTPNSELKTTRYPLHATRYTLSLLFLVVIILMLLLTGATYQRNKVWQTKLSLWEDAARKSPMKARVHNNLGNCYFALERYFEAIESYKKAAAIAVNDLGIYFNLAISFDRAGLLNQALFYYEYFYSLAPPSAITQKEDVKRRIEDIKQLIPKLSDFHSKTSRIGVSPVPMSEMLGQPGRLSYYLGDGCPTCVRAPYQTRIAQFRYEIAAKFFG
jgi:tetratricopeptide (TPR) repeat protein